MKCLPLMSLAVGLLVTCASIRAEVRGVVEVSGIAPISLSVAPVVRDGRSGLGVQERLEGHLQRSNWFSLVPFLGNPAPVGSPPMAPPGASFVITCGLVTKDRELQLLGFVHSRDGTRQLGKEYRVASSEEDQALRSFADDIVLELTGVEGIASAPIAYVADHSGHPAIFSVTPDGRNPSQLVAGAFECLFPRYGLGSSRLVYTAFPRNFPELMLLDTATGENRSLSSRPGLNSLGALSPDGREVVATLSFSGNPELYVLDLTGRILRRLTSHRGSDLSPAWSPDGTEIAFVSDRAGSPAIYLVDSQGGDEPRRLTHGFNSSSYAVEPAWSPRGDYLAFSGRGSGDLDIWVLRLADGQFFRVTEGGGDEEAPEWAPDNRHLVVAVRRGTRRSLDVLDVRAPANRYEIPLAGKTGLRDPTWSQFAVDSARVLSGPGRTP